MKQRAPSGCCLTIAIFLLGLISGQATAQRRLPPDDLSVFADRFDIARANEVYAAALEFMAPRTLELSSPKQMTIWGLDGLPALDPAISSSLQGGRLQVSYHGAPLISRSLPSESNFAGWAELAASVAQAAWTASPALRRSGTQLIINSFFDELFNHFDPYSRYSPPAEGSRTAAWLEGSAGVGVEIVTRGDRVVITHVKDDGPSAEAHLQPGDAIISVDGTSTRGQTASTVSRWLDGPDNTETVLGISSLGRIRKVRIVRRVITPETVYTQMLGTSLLIQINGFTRDTDRRVAAELLHARERGSKGRAPNGLIIDLRGNRGGLLRQAAQTADLVLGGGVVAITEGRDPVASTTWQARPDDISGGLPIIVLVDGRTASAAEILAAALQDHGRAVLVGSATLGKGLVQTVLGLPDGGELFVTWSRVLAPAGYPLQSLGVLPQICTSLGSEALASQLAALAHGRLEMLPALLRHDATRPSTPPSEILQIRASCPAAEGGEQDLITSRRLLAMPGLLDAARLSLNPAPP